MSDLSDQFDHLFGASRLPGDLSGALALLAEELAPLEPRLLFLADASGRIVALHSPQPAPHDDWLHVAATGLAAELPENGELRLRPCKHPEPTACMLLGARLSDPHGPRGLLGCIVGAGAARCFQDPVWSRRVQRLATLAWVVVRQQTELAEGQTRIRHLMAEQTCLWRTNAAAIDNVLQEREDRLREKREYIVNLEQEVASRSADLREAVRRAEQASRAKSEFLANMSHEIRTPLTAVLGFADVILERAEYGDCSGEIVDAARTVKRNAQHLLSVIGDILDLSKVEAGRMTCEKVRCSLFGILADIASLAQTRAEEKGLEFKLAYESAVPDTIYVDPTRLRQILINVVGNALKFTESGSVQLSVRFCDGAEPYMQFDVVDTGIGMTDAQVAGLFRPFTQADNSTTRRFGGTGLGLTISQHLAQMLDGEIRVVRTAYGVGTHVRVTIGTGSLAGVGMIEDPTSATIVAGDARAQANTGEPGGLVARVLLAEDGLDNQRLVVRMLQKAGAEVSVAENGELALRMALEARDAGRPYDVVLMDMQMPVMDGYEATRRLRAAGYAGPIIALTAHAMHRDRERCLEAGCDDYAAKPIDRAALLAMMRRQTDAVRQSVH